MLTDEQVAAIAARLQARWQGQWERVPDMKFVVSQPGTMHVATCDTDGDVEFIAHAPEDVATLLAERAALLEILRQARAELEWREARESASLEIIEAVARAMVITTHGWPDTLCPHWRDGKAWPLRTKARAVLGLTWLQSPQEPKEPKP